MSEPILSHVGTLATTWSASATVVARLREPPASPARLLGGPLNTASVEIRVQAVPLNFRAAEERLAQKARKDLTGNTGNSGLGPSDDQVVESYVNAVLDRQKFVEIFNEVHKEVINDSGYFILGDEPSDPTSWIHTVAQEVTRVLNSQGGRSSTSDLSSSQVWTPESVQALIEDARVPVFGSPPVDFVSLISVLTTQDHVIHLAVYRCMNPRANVAAEADQDTVLTALKSMRTVGWLAAIMTSSRFIWVNIGAPVIKPSLDALGQILAKRVSARLEDPHNTASILARMLRKKADEDED